MTNTLLGLGIGIFIGYQTFKIRDILRFIEATVLAKPKAAPAVLSGNPALRRPEQIDHSPSIIVPKTPQMIDFEEIEEIRKMNPGGMS